LHDELIPANENIIHDQVFQLQVRTITV